jgi:hypothetical protein
VCHVPLGAAPKTPSFSLILGMLLVHELLEWEGGVCGIDVHQDVLIVQICHGFDGKDP